MLEKIKNIGKIKIGVNTQKIIFGIFLFVIFGIVSSFGYSKYQSYIAERQVENINKILDENLVGRESCEIILDFDKTLLSSNNKFFDEAKYDDYREKCDLEYNIENIEINEQNCIEIIKYDENYFENKYIILNKFTDIQNQCTSEFLKVEFSTGSLFDMELDFKSTINIDFSLDFFEDTSEEGSQKYIDNRIKAKQRLLELLEIKPQVDFSLDDIVLYPKKAILYLNLKPLTEYKFSLKSFETKAGKDTKKQEFIFTTPENKFFGFKVNEKVSLFADTNSPNFTFYRYNNDKKEAKIKICRIDNESYAKIEIFNDLPNNDLRKNFFKTGIDKIKTYDCKTKNILLSGTGELVKQEFNFTEEIGSPARSGLYYVTFENENDREFNNIIQKPIFFGIIDSHITMKISSNSQVFFFVNDFSGKPLVNQEIRVYLNSFESQKKQYDNVKKDYNITYNSPIDKNVLSKAIVLGKTDKNGILQVNLKGKIDNAFDKTMDSWDYDWNGNLNSLFVTSASETNLSYVSSKHNGGITPWNFGYSLGGWWYGARSENADEINLETWGVEPEMYSHIFTDRKLYLPNEEVNIKAILRNSSDLSIPKNKEVKLIVRDSNNKEILNENIKTSNYGSFSKTIKLNDNSPLGSYYIDLNFGDENIGNTGFSVEVFKNPKFKNEIMLEAQGLNNELVKITKKEIKKDYYWEEENYLGNFNIKARVNSKYYNGASLKNAAYTYRVFKQYYYDNSYWDECYYGCYWEAEKEFYTEGKGILDENGNSVIDIPVKFESNYSDYKYIVEVTVEDIAGDIISSSNSIIARLPDEYKKWDPDSGINFLSQKRFYKMGEKIQIEGSLNHGNFSEFYNDKFLLIVKKKEYETKIVKDVRGYERPVTNSKEIIEKILLVNTKNFILTKDGKVNLDYVAKDSGEYVFEFGKINKNYFVNSQEIIKKFKDELAKGNLESYEYKKNFKSKVKVDYNILDNLVKYCDIDLSGCTRDEIIKKLGCKEDWIDETCVNKEVTIEIPLKIEASDLIDPDTNRFFTIISYGDKNATNPIISDNKLQILSEKISYHIGEKASILIRLPESEGKILLTREKQGVISSELIDVKSNIFFKEFTIDDSFVPNTYISALFIPKTKENIIPEYKIGYTEIVVDKTDKKSFIGISTDKKVYKPRETVKLDINVSDINKKALQSELTVMVVDDSLISLMGNVDLNTLEKFYKKLPFRIQTAITNIAMLKNYYFSRRGIVGGSGFENLKGGDGVISSRNIFRNTAYYNPSVITDINGKAHVEFNLPDNLTNFRVMIVSNSVKNFFGMGESFIEVRKNVVVEDRTPFVLRNGDISEIGANVFNNTNNSIGFKVELNSDGINIDNKTQNVFIKKGESKFVTWRITVPSDIKEIKYKISAIGNSTDNSDSIENKIGIKTPPVLITNTIKNLIIPGFTTKAGVGEVNIDIPENIDIEKSKVEVSFSNNKLHGIEKIVSSLLEYPYGCVEQTVSSTMPNAIILKFSSIYGDNIVKKQKALENIKYGIERIKSMQLDSGSFGYWQGDSSEASLSLNSYILGVLIEIKKVHKDKILDEIINKNISYLEGKFLDKSISKTDKIEIYLSLAKAGKKNILEINSSKLDEYDLINYTYALILTDKNKFKLEIDGNIIKLKQSIKNDSYNNYYSNSSNNKALFLQLLISVNYDKQYIDNLVGDLYSKDWSSYYYSTQTKNNTFLSFAKYLEKYNVNKINKFGFIVGNILNRDKVYSVGETNNVIKKFEYNLSEIISQDKKSFTFKVANLHSADLFADIVVKEYPKDILKVKAYSNKVSVKREIFEVLDETKLDECTNYWNYYNNVYSNEVRIKCDKVLKKVDNYVYKKGSLYRVKVLTNLSDKNAENFVIEDYLPGAFIVINSKFQTESALVTQNTKNNNWYWDHTEYRPDVVMAHSKYNWGDIKELSYYVRAEFAGIYMQPPVTGYFMYNPLYRANSEFNIIEVK